MVVGDVTDDVVAVLEVLDKEVEDPGPEVKVEVELVDEDGPGDTVLLPETPVIDGVTVNVAVGNMVVVITVVVMMVVGPFIYITLLSP